MLCYLLKTLASGPVIQPTSIRYLSTNFGFLCTTINRTPLIRATSYNDTRRLEKSNNRNFSVGFFEKEEKEKKDSGPARQKIRQKRKKERREKRNAKQLAKEKLKYAKELGLDVEKKMISLCFSMPRTAVIHISKIQIGNEIKIGPGFAQRIFAMLTSTDGTEILKNS